MLTEPQFWKAVLRRSFRGGWVIAEAALVVVEIIFNALEAFKPDWAQLLRLFRAVPIILLFAVIFIGSYRNAYAIYRELAQSTMAMALWGTWRMVAKAPSSEFTITLDADFSARRSDGKAGSWEMVGNEAWITWADRWKDKLRLQPDGSVHKTALLTWN